MRELTIESELAACRTALIRSGFGDCWTMYIVQTGSSHVACAINLDTFVFWNPEDVAERLKRSETVVIASGNHLSVATAVVGLKDVIIEMIEKKVAGLNQEIDRLLPVGE